MISEINFSNLHKVPIIISDIFCIFFLKRKLSIFVKDAMSCKSQSQQKTGGWGVGV